MRVLLSAFGLTDGRSLRADYLVGCDGGRSLVRKAAGIEFAGWDPTTSSLIAEVEMARSRNEAYTVTRSRSIPRAGWEIGVR